MIVEQVDTLIVGAGQAGLAMSEHLGRRGIVHLVLERGRIAERWRSERWDSLVANGPAWHDRFPTRTFDVPIDDFAGREDIVAYFEGVAERNASPVRCGVEVLEVRPSGDGYRVEISAGPIEARRVVAATGPSQRPVIPPIVPETPSLVQIHSSACRNPAQLPERAVLVVGAGSSGAQIAEELMRAGRSVHLSVGPHDRPSRRYRGRDFCWWLGELGHWEAETPAPGTAPRHDRRERRRRRAHGRLPPPRAGGAHAPRHERAVRGRGSCISRPTWPAPSAGGTRATWRCSTRRTRTSRRGASICPGSPRRAGSGPIRPA